MIRIHKHPLGPRLYVGGLRVHHGPAFGLAAGVAWMSRHRGLAMACAAWAATDWRDFPFTDTCNH